MAKKYKTGLVLSGGGTRGFAHLGVISALNENGIQPDIISGASVGSIVGAFIASGKSPEEIFSIFKKDRLFKYTKLQLPVDGLLRLDGLKEIILNEIPVKNIEDLKIPFFVSVSNLNKGIAEYKNSGPLAETVLASSSIPALFSPVKINGDLYVDGGLMDNIPTEPIKDMCDYLIISNISPVNPTDRLKNLIQITYRTFYMSVNAYKKEINKTNTIFIEPEGIDKYEILSTSHAQELYDLGYQSTIKVLKDNESGTILNTIKLF